MKERLMSKKDSPQLPAISIGNRMSEMFEDLENRIRERAYGIFLDRGTADEDPVGDWLAAQSELVSPIELEIKEQKKNILVEAGLKGFAPSDIEIEVEGDTLKVFGSHTETESSKEDGRCRVETQTSRSSDFYQSITLPAPVDLDQSHAKFFKNGKLKITLPRVTPLK
jgi:HSP20 family molecular chaperone IbpA